MNISYTLPLGLQFNHITVTSKWARWHLISPASGLLTQPFLQVKIKENTKAPRHWPSWRQFTGYRWIPCTQRASNAENVSIGWRHNERRLSLVWIKRYVRIKVCHYRPHNMKGTQDISTSCNSIHVFVSHIHFKGCYFYCIKILLFDSFLKICWPHHYTFVDNYRKNIHTIYSRSFSLL